MAVALLAFPAGGPACHNRAFASAGRRDGRFRQGVGIVCGRQGAIRRGVAIGSGISASRAQNAYIMAANDTAMCIGDIQVKNGSPVNNTKRSLVTQI